MIPAARLVQLLADPESGFAVSPLIDLDQVGDGHIDLRLGPDVIVSRRAVGAAVLDPVDPVAFRIAREERHEYVRRSLGDSFHLQPGEFAIARSLEFVSLPYDLSAEVLGRSSWGRLGLTIATATLVQPGFGGTITLELANLANTPIVLHVGARIAQLSFATDSSYACSAVSLASSSQLLQRRRDACGARSGRYLTQLKPELSRIERDRDLAWIAPSAVRYVIGVVGHRYAGKTRVVEFLISQRGFRLYRFMHLLRETAQQRGFDPEDLGVLRRLGNELREQHGKDILARMLWQRIRSDLLDTERRRKPVRIVVEGFKLPQELHALGHLAAFRPLVVDCAELTRVKRAEREDHSFEPGTPPPPDGDELRLDWLDAHVDNPQDVRHPLGPVVELADSWGETVRVDNSHDWNKSTESALDAVRKRFDAAWRAGRLEPNLESINGLAGNAAARVRP